MNDLLLAEMSHEAVIVLSFIIPGLVGLAGGVASRWLKWTGGWVSVASIVLAALAACLIYVVPLAERWDLQGGAAEVVPFFWVAGGVVGAIGFGIGKLVSWPWKQCGDSKLCEQCGYSLRGVSGDPIICPECGKDHRKRGPCPICAYDLRDAIDAGCPECGWGRDPAERAAP